MIKTQLFQNDLLKLSDIHKLETRSKNNLLLPLINATRCRNGCLRRVGAKTWNLFYKDSSDKNRIQPSQKLKHI